MYSFKGNQHRSPFIQKLIYKTKITLIISALLCIVAWSSVISAYLYNKYNPITITEAQTIVKTVKDTTLSPVMLRIMKCESNGQQFNKDGQLLIHANNNNSYDIGIFQINSVHNASATKLGFDLSNKEDNISYAQYLYENYGTEAWYSSRACWSK